MATVNMRLDSPSVVFRNDTLAAKTSLHSGSCGVLNKA